jgi:hypothetical protein
MNFFNRTKYVEGADVDDMKVTLENIFGELRDPRYDEGIDTETMILTLKDLYKYITGTSQGRALRLPAPAVDPQDKYNTMWPEGTKVRTRSRRDSHASKASSVASNGVRVPRVNQAYSNSRASTNTSQRYAPVRATFIDDDVPEQAVRNLNMRDIRNSAPTAPRNDPTTYSRAPTTDRNERSYNLRGEPAPAIPTRIRPRLPQHDPVEEEETEQIETRAHMPRPRPLTQRSENRRSNRPVFLEDE